MVGPIHSFVGGPFPWNAIWLYVNTQVVTDTMTEVLCALLDAAVLHEDDVEEPVEIGLDLDLALVAGTHTPPEGGVPHDGGLPPMDVARLFGTRTQFRMGGLSIAHSLGRRGWWYAVVVEQLAMDDVWVAGLDAHITLFYLRSDHNEAEAVAGAMTACLQQILQRRGRLPVDFNAAGSVSQWSSDDYAMIELLVACPAHQVDKYVVCTIIPLHLVYVLPLWDGGTYVCSYTPMYVRTYIWLYTSVVCCSSVSLLHIQAGKCNSEQNATDAGLTAEELDLKEETGKAEEMLTEADALMLQAMAVAQGGMSPASGSSSSGVKRKAGGASGSAAA